MDRIAHFLNLIPSGLRTNYQKEVERLVARELLEIPDDQSLDSSELQSLFGVQELRSLIQPDLLAYSSRRAGITGMAGSAVTLIATALVVFTLSALTLLTVVLSDPVQHRMGVHRRQLLKLLDSLEAKMVLMAHRQFGTATSK